MLSMIKTAKFLSSLGRPKKHSHVPTDTVCQVRAILNLTQEQMAQKLKCSISTVRDMEQKQRLPGTHALKDNFARLAKQADSSIESPLKDESND